ncbi:hypothetical protein ACS0TY_023221 [Phlomoides rotata]
MNYGMWDWQGQDYGIEDHTSIEMPKSLMNEVDQDVDRVTYIFNKATPIKACGDIAYHVTDNELTGKDFDQYREHSSVKRRRMLQFESDVLETPICLDEEFLRSKETPDSLEDAISEMSQWVAGYTDGVSASSNECLDASSEGWIADCFNDTEMHFCTEDFNYASGASGVQIDDVIDIHDSPPQYDPNPVKKHPINTHPNVVLKGRKSYMHMPPKMASSIVYPFAFIKPCGIHGDVTLKDINRRILNPPKPKPEDPIASSYPTSAFSGKPVVGKTKIQTEGGKGSITIMRTIG